MADFLATQIIKGYLNWDSLIVSKRYKKFADSVLEVLDERGYKLNEKNEVVNK